MEAERLACWFNSLTLCKERYPFVADRIDVSLILPHAEGKLWIKEQLDELGIIFENTAIVGGWFCQYLAYALSNHTEYMCNYEIDPYAVEISKTFNRYQSDKFTSSEKDLFIQDMCSQHLSHGNIELFVNTSCEHMFPMIHMRKRVEKQIEDVPMYVLQSTDEDKYDDHINCVRDPEELADQSGMSHIYYSGTKTLSNGMKRFMVIGR